MSKFNDGRETPHVLLVNDDSYAAEGIATMRDGLLAAGYRVTLVAPLDLQSGNGTALDLDLSNPAVTVTEYAPDQYHVDGTPVITTLAGLDYVLADDAPDLVVSGINEGANVGEIAISSGTVSAAVTALLKGVPSVAISAGLADITSELYQSSSDLVTAILEDMSVRQALGHGLLPDGVGLNVNVPDGWNGHDVAYTEVTGNGGLTLGFTQDDPASDDVTFGMSGGDAEGDADSEGINFGAGKATISAMDGDWSTDEATRAAIAGRLDDLSAAAPSAATESLNIMLVNDDGYGADGIETLAKALADAGHTVKIIAPAEQQSGQGTTLDIGKLGQAIEVTSYGDGNYAVDSSPVNVTRAGLQALFDGTPDMILSGINAGENTGAGTISSGTVSAAVTGIYAGIPSIAVSAGLDANFAVAQETYDTAASFTVDLLADLIATAGGGDLLPGGVGLSVNVPSGDIQGISVTHLDEVSSLGITVGAGPDGEPMAGLVAGTPNGDPLSEGSEFLNGKITVTPIDGDYTAPDALADETDALVSSGMALAALLGDEVVAAKWKVATGDGEDNWLLGNARGNILTGLDGDDLLSGKAGEDLLRGGRGDDVLTGGASADQFIFRASSGSDAIVDFDVEEDHLVFKGAMKGFEFHEVEAATVDGAEVAHVLGLDYGCGSEIVFANLDYSSANIAAVEATIL